MKFIIKFKNYCFNNYISLTSRIYNYINNHDINKKNYDFTDLLFFSKQWRSISKCINIQDLNNNYFGIMSDGLRSIFLNRDEVNEEEILEYLPKSDFAYHHSFYSHSGGGSDSEKICFLNVLLTGPGIYRTAFFISKGETKLTHSCLGYWPFDYIDEQKNIIWFDYADEHYYEDDDDDKFLKLSVNDFLAAMTTAKIYSAPNAFVSVFWWDEETQIMTLSINNMFFEIDPAIGNINHPRVFWNECYYSYGGEGLDTQSKTLDYNYYPEKS